LKTFLAACALALCHFHPTSAQTQSNTREVRGKGKIINKTFSVATFEAIEIEQFPANVEIQVTDQPPSLHISLDENLLSQLSVKSENDILKLALKDPDNREFWITKEDTMVRS